MLLKKVISLSVAVLLFTLPNHAKAMSIEDAYKAIPKRQITYDPYISTLDETKSQYLNAFFSAIDRAVALRVELLQFMYHDHSYDIEYYRQAYLTAIDDILSLPTPYDHYETQSLVVDALREQWQFFEQWHYAEGHMRDAYKQYGTHPYVKSSSKKLIRAYNIFMGLYPGEADINRQSFYNHLCALDFI